MQIQIKNFKKLLEDKLHIKSKLTITFTFKSNKLPL